MLFLVSKVSVDLKKEKEICKMKTCEKILVSSMALLLALTVGIVNLRNVKADEIIPVDSFMAFECVSANDNLTLPSEVSSYLPADDVYYEYIEDTEGNYLMFNKVIDPANWLTVDNEGRTWHFLGYYATNGLYVGYPDEIAGYSVVLECTREELLDAMLENEKLVGKWMLMSGYKANYSFVSEDTSLTLPQEVTSLLPTDSTDYLMDKTVSAITPSQTTVTTTEGTWTFVSYDTSSHTIDGYETSSPNINFTGTWKFTKKEESSSTTTTDTTTTETVKKAGSKDLNSDGVVTCEEEMNNKNWIWSESQGKCIYKVVNTSAK